MRTYLKTYDFSKITEMPWDTYMWCKRNNFETVRKADGKKFFSFMKVMLEECINDGYGTLIVAHDGIKNVGWGLVYECEDDYTGKVTTEFQVYVPPRYRRRGIGTKILEKATKVCGKVEVFVHDVSENFYSANGLTKKGAITGRKLKKKAA